MSWPKHVTLGEDNMSEKHFALDPTVIKQSSTEEAITEESNRLSIALI